MAPGKVEIRPAGLLNVELFSEVIFKELRTMAQVADDFVNAGWTMDDFVKGGGKGGTLMAFAGDFIVKELSPADHATLLLVAASYAEHVRSGDTLLCPIYLHFRDQASGRKFFVMRNITGKGPFRALYDLKGCADDKTIELNGEKIEAVHKRIWNVGMWCTSSGWTPERHKYYKGKKDAWNVSIDISPSQRTYVLRTMKRDINWLTSWGLMDYSLLVCIRDVENASRGIGPSSLGRRPLVVGGPAAIGEETAIAVQVHIIDFLQRWTNGKRIARCIKFAERNKATMPPAHYGSRFFRHFESRLVGKGPSPPPQGDGICQPAGDLVAEGRPEDRVLTRSTVTTSRANSRAELRHDWSRADSAAEEPLTTDLHGGTGEIKSLMPIVENGPMAVTLDKIAVL